MVCQEKLREKAQIARKYQDFDDANTLELRPKLLFMYIPLELQKLEPTSFSGWKN